MSRQTFGMFVDKAFWALLLGVASYGVNQISKLNDNVSELNVKMAVVLVRVAELDQLKADVRDLQRQR